MTPPLSAAALSAAANCHVRFGSGGGAVAYPDDHNLGPSAQIQQ